MAVEVTCPSCSKAMRLPEEVLGKTIKCPRCQKRISVQRVIEKPKTDAGFEVVEERICSQCHQATDREEAICSQCGFNLRTEKKRQQEFGDASESAIVGSKSSGTYNECLLQRENETWRLIIDRWVRHRQSRTRVDLGEIVEARTNFYGAQDESTSVVIQLVDRDGQVRSLGRDLPVKWLLENLQFKAGLNIRRI